MIYFIQVGEDGPVKIGKAKDPISRLSALQTGSHERLYLRAVLDEPDEAERTLHNILSSFKMKGEWFRLDMATLCVMACALAGFVYTPKCTGGPCVEGYDLPVYAEPKFDRTAYQREYMAVSRAVKAGRAEWLRDRP